MFALEINFLDGVSSAETIFVRRPQFQIGSSENAHVSIEGAALGYEIRISRSLGRKFYCKLVNTSGRDISLPVALEGYYQNIAELNLGETVLIITALDVDLVFKPDESADKASLRIFKSALSLPSPRFPALVLDANIPVVESFSIEQPLIVGKSRRCDFRLEGDKVANEHFRLYCEQSGIFIENISAGKELRINEESITQKKSIASNDLIGIPDQQPLRLVLNEYDLEQVPNYQTAGVFIEQQKEQYPCLLSNDEKVYPHRLYLENFNEIKIGRDPTCHIWINDPLISRIHAVVLRVGKEEVYFTDLSSNGSYYLGEALPKNEKYLIPLGLNIIRLGYNFQIAICFNKEEEDRYNNEYIAFGETNEANVDVVDEIDVKKVPEFQENLKFSQEAVDIISNKTVSKLEESFEFKASEKVVEEEKIINPKSAEKNFSANKDEMRLLGSTAKHQIVTADNLVDEDLIQTDEVADDLLVTQDFYEQELRNQKRFKFITFGFIILLVGFCLMLLIGFLSENYFY